MPIKYTEFYTDTPDTDARPYTDAPPYTDARPCVPSIHIKKNRQIM